MIWIIGGTVETGELITRIGSRMKVTVTVATDTGEELLNYDDVVVGRMTGSEMEQFVQDRRVERIVDMSHPYAVDVSANARQTAARLKIPYLRYVRKAALAGDGLWFQSLDECVSFIETVEGTVFFTTGSKYIQAFQRVRKQNRFVYRVLPVEESISLCRENGVTVKDIVAMLGPFSKEMNRVIFKSYRADLVVMKDSGAGSGMQEKLDACADLNILPVIIGRPEEEGFTTIDEIVKQLLEPCTGLTKDEN